MENIKKALESCIKALKPRHKIVMHSLRRTFAVCALNPGIAVPYFMPLIKRLTNKQELGKEANMVSRGILLIFNGRYKNLENPQSYLN